MQPLGDTLPHIGQRLLAGGAGPRSMLVSGY